jgi:DNA repair exonuclease SbcCD ATPase subunit
MNATELQKKQLNVERRRKDAADKRSDVVKVIEKATADAEAAETEEQVTRDLLARLDAAERAREASERLAEFKDRLEQAEATRVAAEETEAKLALARIPPRAVDELQDLEVEIARARAVEEAAKASVLIAYDNDMAGRVAMDGIPLTGGEERSYDAQAQLSVPGIGTITLRSNRPARSDNHLEQAETKRRTLLASMGVDDLAAARGQQFRAQQMDAALRELQGRLSLLAPEGLPKLREEVSARASVGVEALELKADYAQTRLALAEAEERRKKAKQVLREAEPRRTSVEEALVASRMELASLEGERAQVEAVIGPEDARGERETALMSTFDGLDRLLAEAEAHAERLRAAAVDVESVEAVLRRARSVEEAAEKEISTLRETIAGLKGEIATRSDEAVEEKWRENADMLSVAKARVEAFEKEVAVLQRLSSALENARSEARELYLKPVISELRPLLGLLFDDVSITFDDRTLLPQTILRNGLEEDVERLSAGMREQLSVLTRLAFARLLTRDGRPAPVILDDALVYSDDDRIEKMFDALHRQSKDQQIIVFSCRQRAFQKLGGNILQMTDWQP